jgi:hypothetical protein
MLQGDFSSSMKKMASKTQRKPALQALEEHMTESQVQVRFAGCGCAGRCEERRREKKD